MSQKRGVKIIIFLLLAGISTIHYYLGIKDMPIHNLFRLLFFIPIILAALHFGFKGGVITSLLVCLIYSPFMLLTLGEFGWQAVNELLDIVLFFTAGVITGTLVEKKNISLSKLDDELKRYVLLENYTNSIIESIKSGVVAVNNDMLITMLNSGAKDLLNVTGDCIGQSFMEVFACCEEVNERIQGALGGSFPSGSIEVTLKKEKRESNLKVSVYPLTLEGARKGLVIIIDDVTEVKKLQQQLLRNERLAALGELSTGVAHEIRNPLGIIKAIEQTMKVQLKANEEAVKELEIIDEEIDRANRVIESLMEFGKPGKDEKAFQDVNLILEDVLAITNKYLLQHKVTIEVEKSELPEILADSEQLKQVFINIVFNAAQAMPTGGILRISTQNLQNGLVKIAFADTGIGIEEENIEKIFNPFYTTKDEGTGLGLSIVHRIVESHCGRINVFSKVGTGTTFEILLPLGREEQL
ncbi:MAG: hypothetical protein K0R31_333 [Clostridiales bacterium]|nr:hypothetical protein [Clostridiales bacterium]